ncbi:MAG: exosortase H-associated membrane protein [Ottowia sp.]|nr:hypothetical protein [Ottowia sp.]
MTARRRIWRFGLVTLFATLLLMPAWYWVAADLAKPVLSVAGWSMTRLYSWASGFSTDGVIGQLHTSLSVLIPQPDGSNALGFVAPRVDYRMHGYGMVLLWALFLGSWPRRIWLKLPLATVVIFLVEVLTICVAWLHQVLNLSEAAVFIQTGHSTLAQEVVLFLFHFDLYITTVFAPILVWAAFDWPFVAALAPSQARRAPAAPDAPAS